MASGKRYPPGHPLHRSRVSGLRRCKRILQLGLKRKLEKQVERLERRYVQSKGRPR